MDINGIDIKVGFIPRKEGGYFKAIFDSSKFKTIESHSIAVCSRTKLRDEKGNTITLDAIRNPTKEERLRFYEKYIFFIKSGNGEINYTAYQVDEEGK